MRGCYTSEGQRDHSQATCKRQGMVQGEGASRALDLSTTLPPHMRNDACSRAGGGGVGSFQGLPATSGLLQN